MRSTFSSSSLVRSLSEWAPLEDEASGMDFAERLSLWLNAFDAIHLQSAQQAIRGIRSAAPAAAAGVRAPRTRDAGQDLQAVRGTLAKAIAQPLDAAADEGYAPWLQRHAELQRQMDLMIGPLRDHLRQQLARSSPQLRQLAAMDAVMEQVLAGREQALLPIVPVLLERRHAELRAAGCPEDFTNDWRQALLAELDLRLAPVAGLVEALGSASRHQQ